MDDLTKTQPAEHVYKVGKFIFKSAAGFLPAGASGVVSEAFDLFISNPSERRRDAFMMALARRLDELAECSSFEASWLVDNEETSAYLMQAIQIAVRSRGERKLEALREATIRGTIADDDVQRAPGYVVLNFIDRFTDYHLLVLRWEAGPRLQYTGGQLAAGHTDSILYGHPVTKDPTTLKEPKLVLGIGNDVRYFVEKQSYANIQLAHADLVSMGLLVPKYEFIDMNAGRERHHPDIQQHLQGYEVSDIGKLVVSYTEPVVIVEGAQSSTGR